MVCVGMIRSSNLGYSVPCLQVWFKRFGTFLQPVDGPSLQATDMEERICCRIGTGTDMHLFSPFIVLALAKGAIFDNAVAGSGERC